MTTSFDRFRRRNKLQTKATDKGNAAFVFSGYNSTTIVGDKVSYAAAVVNDQENDKAYIYTHLSDSLDIGSVWTVKNLHFLITEEIVTIKDVQWHKYAAVLCNVQIGGYWGKFSTSTNISTSVTEKSVVISLQHPILVLPSDVVDYRDVVIIKGRPWMVQEYDSITDPGITYYSLIASTASKDAVDSVIKHTESYDLDKDSYESGVYTISANTPVTLNTEDGYFKYDKSALKILARTATSVTFQLPFGLDTVVVQTKQDGQVVSSTYQEAE